MGNRVSGARAAATGDECPWPVVARGSEPSGPRSDALRRLRRATSAASRPSKATVPLLETGIPQRPWAVEHDNNDTFGTAGLRRRALSEPRAQPRSRGRDRL